MTQNSDFQLILDLANQVSDLLAERRYENLANLTDDTYLTPETIAFCMDRYADNSFKLAKPPVDVLSAVRFITSQRESTVSRRYVGELPLWDQTKGHIVTKVQLLFEFAGDRQWIRISSIHNSFDTMREMARNLLAKLSANDLQGVEDYTNGFYMSKDRLGRAMSHYELHDQIIVPTQEVLVATEIILSELAAEGREEDDTLVYMYDPYIWTKSFGKTQVSAQIRFHEFKDFTLKIALEDIHVM